MSLRGSLLVRPVSAGEIPRLKRELDAHHWLGYQAAGQTIRYVGLVEDRWVAVAVFGAAALSCTVREVAIGWDPDVKRSRLPLLVANTRLCVLPGAPTHTASAFLAGCLRRVSGDYLDRWGHPVLAVESFTDPTRHRGTCYAAAGFTPVGTTSGYARTGGASESYTFHGQPKRYWLKPLHRHGLAMLAAPFDAPATFPPATRPVIDINAVPLDHGQDNLLDLMYTVTDTRHNRGVRHDLASILTSVVAGSLCGAGGYGAIAQWAAHQSQDGLRRLGTRFNRRRKRYVPPSMQTIRRAVRSIDPAELDQAVGAWLWQLAKTRQITMGQYERLVLALDGKVSRGAHDPDGAQLNLFSALVQGQRLTVAQQAISSKTNEIPAFITLLDQLDTNTNNTDTTDRNDTDNTQNDHTDHTDRNDSGDSDGPVDAQDGEAQDGEAQDGEAQDGEACNRRPLDVIVTADALHTQRKSAAYLRSRGGDYVFVAKDNQIKLADGINDHAWQNTPVAYTEPATTRNGRTTSRVLKLAPAPARLPFPGAAQIFELIRTVTVQVPARIKNKKTKTGKPQKLTRAQKKKYRTIITRVLGVTSLTATKVTPAELAALIRGQWQIEAHHNLRDVTFGEDRSQIPARGAHILATIRSLAVALIRLAGFDKIAHTRRDLAWDQTGEHVLQLLGV
jgi:predicted transposase YbfD/YdcC